MHEHKPAEMDDKNERVVAYNIHNVCSMYHTMSDRYVHMEQKYSGGIHFGKDLPNGKM
jgi:hypothetical protein